VRAAGPAIACDGLVRCFGRVTAVDHISLAIAAGEVFGLLGANGSGKSTTIRMLTGILAPTAGRIEVDGVDVVREPLAVRARIGYVAQKVSLYPNLRVGENVAFYGGIYGLTRRAVQRRVEECAPWLGLDAGDMQALARELPAGTRQRLAILLALLHRPRVVFLDEPTAGVDLGHRRALFDLMHRLAAAGIALLVTSHHLDEMERCSRLAFIDHGKLLGVGTPDDLKETLGGGRRFAVRPRKAELAAAAAVLRAHGVRVEMEPARAPGAVLAWTAVGDDAQLRAAAARIPDGVTLTPAPPSLGAVFTAIVAARRTRVHSVAGGAAGAEAAR
jgi:ABC-2 type transport system ATP-binding protein